MKNIQHIYVGLGTNLLNENFDDNFREELYLICIQNNRRIRQTNVCETEDDDLEE